MEVTKEAIFNYLIEPSPLFLKQVVDVAEMKGYILVRDSREMKKRAIPDPVLHHLEIRLQHLRLFSYKCQQYDGVQYVLVAKPYL